MYTQSITRSRRTAFFLAIDCSGSMAEPIRFRGRPTTKAEAVASVANGLLFELIERARRSDGVRNYYDIAVLGYSGDDEVSSLLPGDRDTLSVTELAAVRPDVRRETVECRLPDGGIALRELPVPVWIEPRAAGQTPMCEALRRIRELKALGCVPFAQPYRDFENKIRPTPEQRRLARWCNHKPTFHTVNYKNYKE